MEMKVKVQPFRVPNYIIAEPSLVQRGDSFVELPKWPLNEADPELLDYLCNQFRRDVFAKAEKTDPLRDIQAFHHN